MSLLQTAKEDQVATSSTTTCTVSTRHPSSEKLTFMEGYIRKYIESDTSTRDDYMQHIAAMDNIQQLRQEIRKLYDQYHQQSLHIKKLEFDIEMEQGHANILRHENQSLKKAAVDMSILAEQEEESISNKLLKHITGLKKEKGELLIQVEQEEEWLTNMLQKKLVQLQKEKIDLENSLEQEQEYMVNRLQKQLELLRQQHQQISPIPSRHGSSACSSSSIPANPVVSATAAAAAIPPSRQIADFMLQEPPGLVEVLRYELTNLRARAMEMEKEYYQKHQQCHKYKTELIQFRRENKLPLEDIDDGRLPRVFRAMQASSNSEKQGRRSASNSSQRSTTTPVATTPSTLDPFELTFMHSSHSFVSPQSISGSRSPSASSSASSSLQRNSISSSRRISGSLFGLSATPPQHPPQL
ncbi:Polynucleotide 5'-hydroxyl-kinase grc3 [Mucor velutinosus]|uniref:Polynucleotide 5'-hydroxyl-kinase grc3 n=1 Tax=Mucor velutinosus TaxID=708070 RepID=A0AAN7D5Y2_9FUNG|nr:Polynucleotide 5'-hydroxyl-kinase grc3 [Mucor velutinosus]